LARRIPIEVWILILTGIELSPKVVRNFARGCRMFREICKSNYLWYHSYKYTFPILHQEKSEVPNFHFKFIEWKSEIEKNYLLLGAFSHIIKNMNESKESGNDCFRNASKIAETDERTKEYERAITYYKQAFDLEKHKDSENDLHKYLANDKTFY
jgi:hypothetical protein